MDPHVEQIAHEEPAARARRQTSLYALTLPAPWEWVFRTGLTVACQPRRPLAGLLGQVVALHAGEGVDRALTKRLAAGAKDLFGAAVGVPAGGERSAFFAFGRLASCFPAADPEVPEEARVVMTDAWCWVFEDVVFMPRALPARGQAGLWPVPDGYRHLLRAAWRACTPRRQS